MNRAILTLFAARRLYVENRALTSLFLLEFAIDAAPGTAYTAAPLSPSINPNAARSTVNSGQAPAPLAEGHAHADFDSGDFPVFGS
jgi:hypothetical protein